MRAGLYYLAAAVAVLALLKWSEAPYVWIALISIGVCISAFRRSRGTVAKMFWLNAGVIVAFLGGYEAALSLEHEPVFDYEESWGYRGDEYFVGDENLGYVPVPSKSVRTIRFRDGEPMYDATYTIDARRMRIAPPVRSDGPPDGCLWFFGGSYTFGEGVQDDESMPYLVGLKTDGRYIVRNFAFHGYGPHQMLAELRTGGSVDRAGCEPTHVIYQGAIWHAMRVAGRVSWGEGAPRFVFDDAGSLVRKGKVKDIDFGGPPEKVLKRLKRSKIYMKHLAKYVDPREKPLDDDDVRLLFAVVEESASLIERAYPDAEFHVLFWEPNPWEQNDLYVEMLDRRGIPMHRISAAIPDYEAPMDARYHLHEGDGHPSALAHDRVSDYVVREILKSEPVSSPPVTGSH